jgi:hypothetical protein
MKTATLLLSLVSLGGSAFICLAEDLPARLPFDRYRAMLNRSPFAVATAVAAPAATPNFAKDLYVANAGHTEVGDYVTIISATDKGFHEYLSSDKANEHGYAISTIQWSEKPGETKVTITKDGQFATLPFNQSLLSGPVPPPPPPQPNQPGMVVPQMPKPHVRGVIQRNPSGKPTYSVAPTPPLANQ